MTVARVAHTLSELFLDAAAAHQLQRVVEEHRMLTRLEQHGLAPRRKLLLIGPPGTGKTMSVAALAGELGLPLFMVRLNVLVTQRKGETTAWLRHLFDAAGDTRSVYCFDRLDAIAPQQSSGNDVGEIRHVLNSLLLMVEQDHSNNLIVATTRHPKLLDHDVFEQFDEVIEYHLPSVDQARGLIRARLGPFAPGPSSRDRCAVQTDGLSHAEITRAVDAVVKDAVLHDQTTVQSSQLRRALEERLITARLNQR